MILKEVPEIEHGIAFGFALPFMSFPIFLRACSYPKCRIINIIYRFHVPRWRIELHFRSLEDLLAPATEADEQFKSCRSYSGPEFYY